MTRLHFLGNENSQRFPTRAQLHELQQQPTLALRAFVQAARIATERLWVLDLHFNPVGYQGLQAALRVSRVPDVRIASERMPEKHRQLSELRQIINEAWAEGLPNQKLQHAPTRTRWYDRLCKNIFPFPHDRFAILDSDLWHFGYAACGGGDNLTAASGPWPVDDHGAIEFFEELCDWSYF